MFVNNSSVSVFAFDKTNYIILKQNSVKYARYLIVKFQQKLKTALIVFRLYCWPKLY